MWYVSAVTSGPADEPVSLATVKAHLRVDSDDENSLINTYITAARSYIEGYCGTAFAVRSITVKCDSFCDFSDVPAVPLVSVSGVTYVDAAGAGQTLSPDVYEVRTDGLTATLALKYGQSWPTIQGGSRITVAGSVGYTTVPEAVAAAHLLLIAHWYENRETAGAVLSEAPHSVTALLTNFRNFTA